MNRRHFLNVLGAGTAGMVLDPERLLWVPGQRTFFLPSATVIRDSAYALWPAATATRLVGLFELSATGWRPIQMATTNLVRLDEV